MFCYAQLLTALIFTVLVQGKVDLSEEVRILNIVIQTNNNLYNRLLKFFKENITAKEYFQKTHRPV